MENSNEPIHSEAFRILRVPSVDYKKKLEDDLKESNKLLVEGGFITKEKKHIWKEVSTFYYCLLGLSIIGIVILCILIPNLYYFRDWEITIFNSCWVLCASAIVFVASEILSKYIECKSFRIPPVNFEKPDSLSTINYIGTSLFGSFRVAGWSGVSYVFLTLFLPIIPIGCYRVRKGMTTSVSRKKQETAYTIFGSEESSGLEILYIYLRYYSIAAFVGGVLGVIAGCSA